MRSTCRKSLRRPPSKLLSTSIQQQQIFSVPSIMSTTENLTALQQKWEIFSEWAAQNPEEWAKKELVNNEMLLDGIDA